MSRKHAPPSELHLVDIVAKAVQEIATETKSTVDQVLANLTLVVWERITAQTQGN